MESTTQAKQELTVEIWSDLICPWCSIGLRKFERALEAFPEAGSVRVVHHAFRLGPGAKTEPVEVVIPRKYGIPPAQAGSMFDRVEAAARGVGLDFRLAGTLYGDTRDGHRLVAYAATVGLQQAVLDRLHRAYFSEGLSLFDRDVLLDLVAEAGLDRVRASEVLESDAFVEEVESSQLQLQEYGVNGVPFFVVGGKYGISGAQDSGVFAQALDQAWKESSADLIGAGDAEICGPEGCEIP